MVQQILKSCKSVIFLNGQLPKLQYYTNIIGHKIKIAADGAANKVIAQGIRQLDYVVGDLDSFMYDECLSVKQVIKIDDQDSTDFEKCMDFVMKKNLSPTLVLGIGGGEIDHVSNNLFCMCNHPLSDIMFLDINDCSTKLGLLVINKYLIINLLLNSKISLIPYPSALVTTNGLKWELRQQWLNNQKFISARNYNISKKVKIDVREGKLLVITDINSDMFANNSTITRKENAYS